MGEPITWRSIAAPTLSAPAVIMRSGNDSMTKGIESLSTLAKGMADEQKGIALSDAVSVLSKAGNDNALNSAFDDRSAAFKANGLDQKDLIAAFQARHKALQEDQAFTNEFALNALKQKTEGLNQEGMVITNKTKQGELDYQPTEQKLNTATLEENLKKTQSDINVNNSNIASARARDALTRAQTVGAYNNQRLDNLRYAEAKVKLAGTEKLGKAADAYFDAARNPENFTKNELGQNVVDYAKIDGMMRASGYTSQETLAGRNVTDDFLRRGEKVEAAKENAKLATKAAEAEFRQVLQDKSSDRKAALSASIGNLDADEHVWSGNWGLDSQKASGTSALTAAYNTTYENADGKEVRVDPIEIEKLRVKHSDFAGDMVAGPFMEDFSVLVSQLKKKK